ncbi:unnamed protein product [Bursaphelenchus xylophilus]|uniref:(pine wood nematode) hypothetical protein n=1 Tax=Bursaphelenchus xylophilus TaxID=6326 RepID=A0A1I7SBK7_BURXY|nr:unnamed protein product [Bursaphelenchus xylophilus]CAG9114425.1 unnamed protein product [Bursaphelenchus xylophilus]
MGMLSWSIFIASLAFVIYVFIDLKDFEEYVVRLAPVRPSEGKLARTAKNTINNIEYVLKGEIVNPECQVIHNGAIYTGSVTGHLYKIVNDKIVKVIDVSKDNPKCKYNLCSVPLGMRYWKDEKVVYADAMLGIFVADFKTGEIKQVFTSRTYIGGWTHLFPDDFDFIDEETIIFTDMNPKCGFERHIVCFFEYIKDGRVITLNLNTGAWEVIAKDLLTPNGVVAHPDKQSALVSSTSASQILRIFYKGPKKGQVEVFADGLPGIPDNIRQSSSGKSFWIAFYESSVNGERPLYQRWSEYPKLRKLLAMLPEHFRYISATLFSSKEKVIIEMDFDGKIVSSLHDPEGRLSYVTNVVDDGKDLYIGSVSLPYIRRIRNFRNLS